jgi:hypothetical protein
VKPWAFDQFAPANRTPARSVQAGTPGKDVAAKAALGWAHPQALAQGAGQVGEMFLDFALGQQQGSGQIQGAELAPAEHLHQCLAYGGAHGLVTG